MLAVLLGLALLVQVPWGALRRRLAVVDRVRVEGTHYLDAARVARAAGLAAGQDLFALDLERARQRLLLHPRIARAEVARSGLRGVRVRIAERTPVLLVRHGVPWEMDSTGVLLEPLAAGATADVPLLTGPDVSRLRAGAQVSGPRVARALAWVGTLGDRELQLAGEVSEVDVSDERATRLVLLDGTRVLGPAWPLDVRAMSALRVVLADLRQRGVVAREVDLRFADQVIVRPAPAAADEAGAPRRSQAG
jgi:cell division septal protein FtsQ